MSEWFQRYVMIDVMVRSGAAGLMRPKAITFVSAGIYPTTVSPPTNQSEITAFIANDAMSTVAAVPSLVVRHANLAPSIFHTPGTKRMATLSPGSTGGSTGVDEGSYLDHSPSQPGSPHTSVLAIVKRSLSSVGIVKSTVLAPQSWLPPSFGFIRVKMIFGYFTASISVFQRLA